MNVLITGVTGQDGSYLAQSLHNCGHAVYGVIRSLRHPRRAWIESLVPNIQLVVADLLDEASLRRAIELTEPTEIYNVAAITSPGNEWGASDPPLLGEVTGLGPVRLLNAVMKSAPSARVVHVSSSTIYDKQRYGLYGAAKRLAHDAVDGFRARGLHASNAVLFSHTSPRQPVTFLIRRITRHIAARSLGVSTELQLSNVGNVRDWGHAVDYVDALQHIMNSEPNSYDVLTGNVYSVRDIINVALDVVGLTWDDVPEWHDASVVPVIHEVVPEAPVIPPTWNPKISFTQMITELTESALTEVR